MNGRERVLESIKHKEPDKIPFDLGGTLQTGISIAAYKNLIRTMGLPAEDPEIICTDQQLAGPSETLLKHLNVDTRGVLIRGTSLEPKEYLEDEAYFRYIDGWNMEWIMPKTHGHYFSQASWPLQGVETVKELEQTLIFPDPWKSHAFDGLREKAQAIRDAGYAVIANSYSTGVMEMSAWLTGYEKYYCDLVLNPALTEALAEKILEIKLEYWQRVFEIAGDLIDIVQEGDDLGTQTSLLISPKMYRKMVKPRHRALADYIHKKSNAKIFFHSCGAIRPLIQDLIEVGMDILNPVQFTAENMDAASLKRDFGKDLTFWGGGIDTQKTLPHGTKQEIKEMVKRQMDILGRDGGFIMTTVHNIQADVPPENLKAYFEAVEECRMVHW